MDHAFYVRIEASVDAKIEHVSALEAQPRDPNGVDAAFYVRIGEQMLKAFTVRGFFIDDEAHLEVSRVNPLAFSRVSGMIVLG